MIKNGRPYWHFDNITKKSEKQFLESYSKWAKKKGYRQNESKAKQIYALAKEGIPIPICRTGAGFSDPASFMLSEKLR